MKGFAALFLCLVMVQAASGQQADEYRLGPEDIIVVDVMGHRELSGEFYVPNGGVIDVQRVGQINVSGKTLREVSELVCSGLKTTLRDPEVVVTLKSPRPQLAHIVGVVQRPGPYSMKPGWRITEGISAAGGIVPGVEPADCTVHILRASTGEKESVPLVEVMRGAETGNKPVYPGDVITIESVELIPIYVTGEVNRPGLYNLRKDSAGVLEAITVAGGSTDDAALSRVSVTHLTGQTETVNMLPATTEGKQQSPVKLQSGDLVVVPEFSARFAVLGWVNSPGFFPLKENQRITLSDALGMARGIDNKRGGLRQVAVIRQIDGKEQRLVFDLSKFTKKGDASQNPEIQSGDIVWVPETDRPDWDKVWSKVYSGLSFLFMANRWGE